MRRPAEMLAGIETFKACTCTPRVGARFERFRLMAFVRSFPQGNTGYGVLKYSSILEKGSKIG